MFFYFKFPVETSVTHSILLRHVHVKSVFMVSISRMAGAAEYITRSVCQAHTQKYLWCTGSAQSIAVCVATELSNFLFDAAAPTVQLVHVSMLLEC